MMDYYRNPQTIPTPGLLIRDFGLFLFRIVAGGSLLVWHAWNLSLGAWKHVWNKTEWDFADSVGSHGFPYPSAVAVGATALLVICGMLLVAGVLSRIAAAIVLAGVLVTGFLYTAYPEVVEKTGLYAVILLVICLCGPGRFSLDAALSRKK